MPDALQILLARMGQQLSPSDMIQNMLGRMPPQDEVIPAPNRQYNVYSSEEDQRQSNLPINTAPIYGQRFPRTGDELIYQPRPEFTPTYPSTITTPTGPADVAFADIRNRRTLNKEITRARRGEDTVLPSWIDPSPVPLRLGQRLTPADTVAYRGARPQDQFLQQNAPVPTLSNPRPLALNWVGEPNPNIPPPRSPGSLPAVLRRDLPPAPPTGNAPYQPQGGEVGWDTPLWKDRQTYTPPPMMPSQDDYSRPFSNLGFGGMGAYY